MSLSSTCRIILVAALLCDFAATSDAADRPVAVLPFDVTDGKDDGPQWADLLAVRIAQKTPVVERTQLNAILAELKLGAAGFTAPEVSLKIGKLTGAKTLLTAGMYEVADRRIVALRAVDVETSRATGKTLIFRRDAEPTVVIEQLADVVWESLPVWQSAEDSPAPLRPQVDLAQPAVAVLNFDPVAGTPDEWSWLSAAFGDLTINLLVSQNVRVISRENMQARLQELSILKPGSDPKRAAQALKAERAVHGVYQVADGQVQVRLVLIEAATGKTLHTATMSGPLADVFTLHRAATAEAIDVLESRRVGTLNPAKLPIWNNDLDAGRTLYGGIALFDKGRYLDAWLLFRRAQQAAPNYPDAAYWSGRMMYYVQEYHQARHDLLRFITHWPEHPHVADAGLEVIHSAQSLGVSEREVLETIAFVGALAPQAEVVNFERYGAPTLLGYYADAMTAQIHIGRRRLRDAAEALGRHLHLVPREHRLYSHVWTRMYDLRIRHFNDTGEWFEIPEPPIYQDYRRTARSPGGRHPLNASFGSSSLINQNVAPDQSYDVRAERKFVYLTADKPHASFDLSDDPLVLGLTVKAGDEQYQPSHMTTFSHYVVAPAGHYLEMLTVEIEAEGIDPKTEGIRVEYERERTLSGPTTIARGNGRDENHARQMIQMQPGTRIIKVMPLIHMKPPYNRTPSSQGRVLRWRVEAKLLPILSEAGSLLVRQPADSPIRLQMPTSLYHIELSSLYPGFPGGDHTVSLGSRATPTPGIRYSLPPGMRPSGTSTADETMHILPGRLTEVRLNPAGTLLHSPSQVQWRYKSSAELHTFTPVHLAGLGRAGDDRTWDAVQPSLCEDRQGRLIAVWSVQRDLYLAVSTDQGRTWGPCRQFAVPVNSAHREQGPRLIQDRDGRYVLTFTSDRGTDRNMSAYVCWSNDLQEFSAPVLVWSNAGTPYRLWQRSDGTYLLYTALIQPSLRTEISNAVGVCQSRDLLHWTSPRMLPFRERVVDVVPDGDGYTAFVHQEGEKVKESEARMTTGSRVPYRRIFTLQSYVQVFRSPDGLQFTPTERIKVQDLPEPKSDADPQCFRVRGIVAQQSGERTYFFVGSDEGKIFRRDGAEWKEVIHLPKGFGCDPPSTIWFFGTEGYLRLIEGPLQWLPDASSAAMGKLEFSAVPQLSATRFQINLLNPEPETGYRGPIGVDMRPTGRLETIVHRP